MQLVPLKKRKLPLADKSKFCKFHKDYRHDTNDCVKLKKEIESLIRKGKLENIDIMATDKSKKKKGKRHIPIHISRKIRIVT